jgi:hypothetical protein
MSFPILAQDRVYASEIIEQINRGEDINYENVTIVGTLDLTDLENQRRKKNGSNWFGSDNYLYESSIEVAIRFVKCEFTGDVLAYISENDNTYIADFEQDVVFSRCVFEKASAFKYSDFPEQADFSRSIFKEDANFKYAEFEQGLTFDGSVFEEDANFKYTEFDDQVGFANVIFEDEANFKYAEFPGGVSFEAAVFNDLANFKYTKFSEPLNIREVVFNGSEDFKYTEIDGKDFTSYLIRNR